MSHKDIVDSSEYGNIIGRIHDDGVITRGTSNEIVGKITDDGKILSGTSRQIIGEIEVSEQNRDSGIGFFLFVFLLFIGVLMLYFSIFLFPGHVIRMVETYMENGDVDSVIEFLSIIAVTVIASIVANICMGSDCSFKRRLLNTYKIAYLSGVIFVFITTLTADDVSEEVYWAIFIVQAVIGVLPTLITSIFFGILTWVRKKSA